MEIPKPVPSTSPSSAESFRIGCADGPFECEEPSAAEPVARVASVDRSDAPARLVARQLPHGLAHPTLGLDGDA